VQRDRRLPRGASTKEDHVKNSTMLGILGGLAATIAIAAPAASASDARPSVPVCNEASQHFQGGGLIALDAPTDSPATRYRDNLSELPGNGEGLVTAARRSPALTLCGSSEPTVIDF
jgi:hypothetical protein